MAAPEEINDSVVPTGVGRDGIPSIDTPSFADDSSAVAIDPGDPVFRVRIDGVQRAYPQSILIQHEIANDTVAGTPIAVTYCPLTGTAQAFERGETSFGVSGTLVNSHILMLDRATNSQWPQMLATRIGGGGGAQSSKNATSSGPALM